MGSRTQRSGFTLVELLIALVVSAMVVAQAFVIFGTQHATAIGHERAVEVQEDARLVANAVLADVRMAGFMVPRVAALASVDGGANAADRLCASDPDVLDDARVAAAPDRFDRARVLAAVGAGANSVQLLGSTLDVDGDGVDDFAVGAGLVLADGASSHCARIEQIAGDTLQFTPPTPAGFSATSAGRAAPAAIYELDAGGLSRNGLRLATQVEDLQVEFGVDADGDGQLGAGEFPIHDLNGSDPARVRMVQITVITRADAEDPKLTSSGRPAAANRSAGAPDDFRRRRVTASVLPRNLL